MRGDDGWHAGSAGELALRRRRSPSFIHHLRSREAVSERKRMLSSDAGQYFGKLHFEHDENYIQSAECRRLNVCSNSSASNPQNKAAFCACQHPPPVPRNGRAARAGTFASFTPARRRSGACHEREAGHALEDWAGRDAVAGPRLLRPYRSKSRVA